MADLTINRLRSGGVITNLYCSAACKHCLYASSPKWDKGYIDASMASKVITKIKELGCHSVHIGGGEPLLNIDGMLQFLQIANQQNLMVEYIETNSSWYKNAAQAVAILDQLRELRVDTLLISMSPFHNEYVPFYKVKGLIAACERSGMAVFPWIRDFFGDINSFDDKQTHSLTAYCAKFGTDYVQKIPGRFPLNLRGRALLTYKDFHAQIPIEQVLEDNSTGCSGLANTSHFHIDLFGNYIPGLCSGLSISVDDLGKALDDQEYLFLHTLYNRGVPGLLEIAQEQYAFVPDAQYVSKCHLCFEIRSHLVLAQKVVAKDLNPVEYYQYV